MALESVIAYITLFAVSLFVVLIKNSQRQKWTSQLPADFIGLTFMTTLINYLFSEQIVDIVGVFFLDSRISDFLLTVPVSTILAALLLFLLNSMLSFYIFLTSPSPARVIGKDDFKRYRDILQRQLKELDDATNWNGADYIELDAEIETRYKNKYRRKTVGLLNALRKIRGYKGRVSLVLGKPGSGKSVAMRKLCLDMLREVSKTNKIPLYVNLREWPLNQSALSPSTKDVENFILSYLLKRTYQYEVKLVRDCFNKLLSAHAIFFIFDSYDELPALGSDIQKVQETRNEKISEAIYRFVNDTKTECVLASRPLRRPTSQFETNTTFEVNALDDTKIIPYLKKNIGLSSKEIKNLLKTNYNIWTYLRNPMLASLMRDYYKNNNSWPENQSIAYESFINSAIEFQLLHNFVDDNISFDCRYVCNIAAKLAKIMLSSKEVKPEISMSDVKKAFKDEPDIDTIIRILEKARICRFSDIKQDKVTFSHNRFQEYFFIMSIGGKDGFKQEDYEDIANCSTYFDIFVLFCEIASESEKEKIANYCVDVILENGNDYTDISNPKCLRAINCLSFLSQAFVRNSHISYNSIFDDLENSVVKSILSCNDLICLSVFAEASGFLDYEGRITLELLKKGKIVVNDILIRLSYYVPIVSRYTRVSYYDGLERYSTIEFVKKLKYFMFMFDINAQTSFLTKYCILRSIDSIIFLFLFIYAFASFFLLNGINGMLAYATYEPLRLVILFGYTPLISFFLKPDSSRILDLKLLLLGSFIMSSFIFTFQINWVSIAITFYFFSTRQMLTIREKAVIFAEEKSKTISGIFEAFSWLFSIILIIFITLVNYSVIDIGDIINIFLMCLSAVTLILVLYALYKISFLIIGRIKFKSCKFKLGQKVSRENIEEEINKLKNPLLRQRYISMLDEAKVNLVGKWRKGRPVSGNEYSDRILANLDIKNLKIYRNR